MKFVASLLCGSGVCLRLHEPILKSDFGLRIEWFNSSEHYRPRQSLLAVIGVPTAIHEHTVERILGVTPWVLVEKPMGHRLDSAIAIEQLARDACANVFVNYQLRFHHLSQILRRRREGGSIEAVIYHSSAWRPGPRRGWYKSLALGGTALYAIVSHILDAFLFTGFAVNKFELAHLAEDGSCVRGHLLVRGSEPIAIEADLCSETEIFALRLRDGHYYDAISQSEVSTIPIGRSGSLASSNPQSPWYSAQQALYRCLFGYDRDDSAMLATCGEAVEVHLLIDRALRNGRFSR